MGDAGVCSPVLSPVSLTASAEGRKAATLQRGSPRGHVPCPNWAGHPARTAPSGTAHRGEQHGDGAVLQRVPKAKLVGSSHAEGEERSKDRELHRSAGALPSWQAQPSRLSAQPAASVSPACPEPSQACRTPCPHTAWPLALTVVGEARFAQTHDKVHFHLVRSHGFGANGALETWRESRETSP